MAEKLQPLIVTQEELFALMSGQTLEQLGKDLVPSPFAEALEALAEPDSMATISVIAQAGRRVHTLSVKGIAGMIAIDLDGKYELSRFDLDALPMVLAQATGIFEPEDLEAPKKVDASENSEILTEKEFTGLFLRQSTYKSVLKYKGWERAWHISAAPSHNPEAEITQGGYIAAEGRGTFKLDADEVRAIPSSPSKIFLEFAEIAYLMNSVA